MTRSQSIIAAAQQTWDVTGSLGRKLTVHRLTALDRLRLFKAVAPHLGLQQRRRPLANPSR